MTLPDKDSLSTYGGPMTDYSDVVDPTTEESADYRNKYAANVAMMTHSVTRAARSFLGTTGGATSIADPSSGFVHDSLWGDGAGVKPAVTHISTGTYDGVWASTVQDELDAAHTLNVRRGWANVEQSDETLRLATVKRTGASTVRVLCYKANASGQLILDDLVGETITVFWV